MDQLGSLQGRRGLLVVPNHVQTHAIGGVGPGGSFLLWI